MKSANGNKRRTVILIIIVHCCILPLQIQSGYGAQKTGITNVNLYMFNVGSGSCSIVELKLNTGGASYILVDAGTSHQRAKKTYNTIVKNIKTFIKLKKIKKFEYVILSHYDSDHVKMLKSLIGDKSMKVVNIICRSYTENTKKSLKAITKKQDIDGTITTLDGQKIGMPATIKYYNDTWELIKEKKKQGAKIKVCDYTSSPITIGSEVKGKKPGVKVALRFLNKSKSYYYRLQKNGKPINRHIFDWRAASNNDSLAFSMSWYDPGYHGEDNHLRKILFCGDIQNGAMEEYVGKKYVYSKGSKKVLVKSASTSMSKKFKRYASDCDLVAGWPHHGKIAGAEGPNYYNYTAYPYQNKTTSNVREDFTKIIRKKNNESICFVSTLIIQDKVKSIKAKSEQWRAGNRSVGKSFDIPSLVNFKDGGYYTNCLTKGTALLAEFNVNTPKKGMKIYACRASKKKLYKLTINRKSGKYYNLNYNFFK